MDPIMTLLTKDEETLIRALRAMGEIPINMLLWYSTGLENSVENIEKSIGKPTSEVHNRKSKQKIAIANQYQRDEF